MGGDRRLPLVGPLVKDLSPRLRRLQAVLDGYAKFLRDKEFELPKHRPHLVRLVSDFLAFASAHAGYTFEQTLDLYLSEVGRRVGIMPWQALQAGDAVRMCRYQYRGANHDGRGGKPAAGLADDAAMLARLREVLRLRHYAGSSERTCRHWTQRLLEYRRTSGCKGAG